MSGKEHTIIGPDGSPIDPETAARLVKNPHLMHGGVRAVGRAKPGPPAMVMEVALSDESIKKTRETIMSIRESILELHKMLDELVTKAEGAKQTLEAVSDAVHT